MPARSKTTMAYSGKTKWIARPAPSVALRYGLALVSVAVALGLARIFSMLPFASAVYRICAIRNRDHLLVRRHQARHSRSFATIAYRQLFLRT
jgi:hypothetical protein